MKNIFNNLFINRESNIVFVWLCNIGAEKKWCSRSTFVESEEYRFTDSIGEINLLLCKQQDYMVLRDKPNDDFYLHANNWGIEKPNFLVPSLSSDSNNLSITELVLHDLSLLNQMKKISIEKKAFLVPYAITEDIEKISEITGLKVLGSSNDVSRTINNKIFARNMLEQKGIAVPFGRIITNKSECSDFCANMGVHEKFVVKHPYGASGEGQFIVDNPKQLVKVEHYLSKKGMAYPFLIEKWYEKKEDINFQFFVSYSGEVELFSIKKQNVNGTVYSGSDYPVEISEDLNAKYKEYSKKIGKALSEYGYIGVVSVDSIFIKDTSEVFLIDINARFSLSTYFSHLGGDDECIIFRQYDIYMDRICSYGRVVELMNSYANNNMQFLVCSPSLLPSLYFKKRGKYYGRVMILMKSQEKHTLEQFDAKIKKVLKEL